MSTPKDLPLAPNRVAILAAVLQALKLPELANPAHYAPPQGELLSCPQFFIEAYRNDNSPGAPDRFALVCDHRAFGFSESDPLEIIWTPAGLIHGVTISHDLSDPLFLRVASAWVQTAEPPHKFLGVYRSAVFIPRTHRPARILTIDAGGAPAREFYTSNPRFFTPAAAGQTVAFNFSPPASARKRPEITAITPWPPRLPAL